MVLLTNDRLVVISWEQNSNYDSKGNIPHSEEILEQGYVD